MKRAHLSENVKAGLWLTLGTVVIGGAGYGLARGATALAPAPGPNTPVPHVQTTTDARGEAQLTMPPTAVTPGWNISIRSLQAALKAAGQPYARLLGTTGPARDGVDGVPGIHTDNSLKTWESDHGLPPTGITDVAGVYRAAALLGVPVATVSPPSSAVRV